MMRTRLTLLALIAYTVVWSSAGNAGLITITRNYLTNYVRDEDASSGNYAALDSYNGTDIPADHQSDATLAEDFYSRTQVDYSGSTTGATLTHSNALARRGGYLDIANTNGNSTHFTANANTTFQLSGALNVDNVSEVLSGRVFFRSFLQDETTGQLLFDSNQDSRSTVDEAFVLGETEGDFYNFLRGSLTGNLIAGHQYRWYSFSQIYALSEADDGATATGFVTLSLGDGGPNAGSVVPEPTSLAMLAIGGLGMIARRRRRAG